MSKIVYYSAGLSGTGQLIRAAAIRNGLIRNNNDAKFTFLCGDGMGWIGDLLSLEYIEIPGENEEQLSNLNFRESVLYKTLTGLKPDVLLVWLTWFTHYYFIDELPAKKIFLAGQRSEEMYHIPLPSGHLHFDPGQYDLLIKTEPMDFPYPAKEINPIIIKNRDEILPRAVALERLGVSGENQVCFLGTNGLRGEFEEMKKTYSYLEEEGYEMVYSSNYDGGLFPAVDYFNAFDLLICGAGYNSFWEAVYFRKEAIFIPIPRPFEDPRLRVERYQDHEFDINGADQLAEIIAGL